MARPKKQETERKKNRLEIRLTDDELKTIDYIAEQLKLSRTEAILEAIQSRADDIWAFEYRNKER